MADGIGQVFSGLGEKLKDEVKTVAKTAGAQIGVGAKPKLNTPSRQAINDLAAKDEKVSSPQLERSRAELAQIAFQDAQTLGVQRQSAAPETQHEKESGRSDGTPPPLEQMPSKGLFGRKLKPNMSLRQAQTKIEDKAGRHG